VTLQALDEKSLKMGEKSPASGDGEDKTPNQNESLGLAFQDPTPDIQSQLPEDAPKGPVVTEVESQGPAAAAGLQSGDIILKVGSVAIVSANQLSVILKKADLKNGVRLFVWRDGVTLYSFLQSGDE
jgi:serine protease Do